jgi:transcriptional regulator with XRE-family HTH domain
MKTKIGPDDRDRVVGERIRTYRDIKGLSQTELGEAIGVTFQQVQKYERGKNKVGVSRLVEISRILSTPLMSFVAGLDDSKNAHIISVSDTKQDKIIQDSERNKEIAELLKIYNSVETFEDRQEIINVLRALATAKRKRAS